VVDGLVEVPRHDISAIRGAAISAPNLNFVPTIDTRDKLPICMQVSDIITKRVLVSSLIPLKPYGQCTGAEFASKLLLFIVLPPPLVRAGDSSGIGAEKSAGIFKIVGYQWLSLLWLQL
jgi:hypothetical protein